MAIVTYLEDLIGETDYSLGIFKGGVSTSGRKGTNMYDALGSL